MTSGLDLPSLCQLSHKVAQRKSGTILDDDGLSLEKEQPTKKLRNVMTAVLSLLKKEHKIKPEQSTVQTTTSQIHGQRHN